MNAAAWWEYQNPVRLRFGAGRLDELPALVETQRTLLVTTAGFTRRGLTERVRALLDPAPLHVLDSVEPNPALRWLQEEGQKLLHKHIGLVVALGGGSVLDTAKALSLMLATRDTRWLSRHLLAGEPLPAIAPLPLIAIPTTAGTGSEVTPFATIWDTDQHRKLSLADPMLYPEVALLDPALTLSLPWKVTVATGLDALSQAFEAIWNRHATVLTTGFAQRAIDLVLSTLPGLRTDGSDLAARTRMMEASLLAGLAISRTRTALAHAISYPITAHYGLPHGLACSFTLPALLAFNAEADDGRLQALAAALGEGTVAALGQRLTGFLVDLGMPVLLAEWVPEPSALVALAPEMLTPGRADNNLHPAGVAAVRDILVASAQRLGMLELEVPE